MIRKIIKLIPIVVLVYLLYLSFNYTKSFFIDYSINRDYDPKYKINDLYKSKELNYRLQLNSKEQKIYDIYIEKILNFESNFTIDMSDFKVGKNYSLFIVLGDIAKAIQYDHPELIQYGTAEFSKQIDDEYVDVTITYTMSKEDYEKNIKEIKIQIDEIKEKTKKLSEYKKVEYVYNYLGTKNNYGEVKDPMGQSAYAAFNDSLSPVCAGYAKASELIFNNIGITSVLATGQLSASWLVSDSHAWNVVKVDGHYYNYDVTQSSVGKSEDRITYYGLLNKNQSDELKFDNKKVIPYIDGKKYDYYDYNNLTYKYSKKNINELKKLIDKTNNQRVELRITNLNNFKNDFNEIKDELNLNTYIIIDDIIILEKL